MFEFGHCLVDVVHGVSCELAFAADMPVILRRETPPRANRASLHAGSRRRSAKLASPGASPPRRLRPTPAAARCAPGAGSIGRFTPERRDPARSRCVPAAMASGLLGHPATEATMESRGARARANRARAKLQLHSGAGVRQYRELGAFVR